jgi:hypothetical protein
MKTFVKIFAFVLVLGSSFAAFANEPETPSFAVGMYQDPKNLILNLMVENSGAREVTVKVYDEKGTLVFDERLGKKQAKYRMKFKMNEMANGTYKFVISDNNQIVTKTVTLQSEESRKIQLSK